MLFVSSFNAIYYFLCRRHLVWEFVPSGINWWLIRLVHIFIVTPLIALNFLSKLPSGLWKQFTYLIKSVLFASIVEYFANKKKLILYSHGWNIIWSGILYVMMFCYSYLFTKRPVYTIMLSLCSTIYFVIKFKVPLKMKHTSKYFGLLVDLYYHTFLEDLFRKTRKFQRVFH